MFSLIFSLKLTGMRTADAEQNRLPLAESAGCSGDNPAHQGNSRNPDPLRLPAYSYSVTKGRSLIIHHMLILCLYGGHLTYVECNFGLKIKYDVTY